MKSWKEIFLVLAVCAVAVVTFAPNSGGEKFDITSPDITRDLRPPTGRLVLVCLDQDDRLTEWCETEIEAFTGVEVERRLRLRLPPALYDKERRQYDADGVTDLLRSVERAPDEVLLAVTGNDLYLSSQPSWRYCFGTHSAHGAVLSPARMDVAFHGRIDDAISQERFRKMVLRYVLELMYDQPRNDDPQSLLYQSVMGPQDLDRMEYRI